LDALDAKYTVFIEISNASLRRHLESQSEMKLSKLIGSGSSLQSDLYEFNKKLKSYALQKEETGQGRENSEPDNDVPAQGSDRDVADE
jgi:hypothetical protein